MKMAEYESVKELDYTQYCDYLQKKYGITQSKTFTTNKPKS